MKKRLSLLMVLMMIVSLLPMSAFADNGVTLSAVSNNTHDIDETASKNRAVFTATLKIDRRGSIDPGQIQFELEGGAKFILPTGTGKTSGASREFIEGKQVVKNITTGSNVVSYVHNNMTTQDLRNIGSDYASDYQLSEVVRLNIDSNSNFTNTTSGAIYVDIDFAIDYDKAQEGAVKLRMYGNETKIGNGETELFKVEYVDYSLNIKVRDDEAVTSFDGGNLSPFEIRKFDGAKVMRIALDEDDYYAFDSDTKVFIDGRQIIGPKMTNKVANGSTEIFINVPNKYEANAKIVRVEPSLSRMGTKATSGDVEVFVSTGTGINKNFKEEEGTSAVIGKVVDFGVTMTVVEKNKKEIPTVWGGETAKVTVTLKGPKGSFSNRPIEFEVDGDQVGVLRNSVKNFRANPDMGTITVDGAIGVQDNTIFKDGKFVLEPSKSFADLTELSFDMELVTKYNFDGTAKVTAYQRGWEVEADAVTVVPKITMTTAATDIKKGGEAVQTKDIVVTEAKAGLLKKGDIVFVAIDNVDVLRQYVTFNGAKGITVEGTNGMTFENIKVSDSISFKSSSSDNYVKKNDRYTTSSVVSSYAGDIGIFATVKTASKGEASVITFAGQKVLVDGSQPDKMIQVKAGLNGYTVTPKADYVNVVKEYGSKAVETVFTIGQTTYTVTTGGETVEKAAHTAPYIKEGRTMLPIRALAESLGLEVQWNSATRTASFTDANKVAAVTIGASTMYVNGTPMPLTVPAELTNDTTFVELRSLATAFGVQIDWDAAAKQAIVSNK